MSKVICVTKIGRSPDLFCDLPNGHGKYMALGDWEAFKLLKLLSDKEPESKIYYVGRCRKWDEETIKKEFPNNNVQYIHSKASKDIYSHRYNLALDDRLEHVDEFHYVLGPVTTANYALDCALLKQDDPTKLKKVICAFKNYVGPLYALMNCHPEALHFPYGTDNKYNHAAFDHISAPGYTFIQCGKSFKTKFKKLAHPNDPITKVEVPVTNIPFRFETLMLYGENRQERSYSFDDWSKRSPALCISMNQVSPDKQLKITRYQQFVDKIVPEFSSEECKILGKWTSPEMVDNYHDYFLEGNTEGFGEDYFDKIKQFKYSAMLFNYKIASAKTGIDNVTDNWLTAKIWESMMLGNITFFEVINDDAGYVDYIPKELMFKTGKELKAKIDKCEADPEYAKELLELQWNSLKEEYFNGEYAHNFIKNVREQHTANNPVYAQSNIYQSLEDVKNKNVRFQEADVWPKE